MFSKWQKQTKHTLIWLDTKKTSFQKCTQWVYFFYVLFLYSMKKFFASLFCSAILIAAPSGYADSVQNEEVILFELGMLVDSMENGKYAVAVRSSVDGVERLIKSKTTTNYNTMQTLGEYVFKEMGTDAITGEEKDRKGHSMYYWDEFGTYVKVLELTTADGTKEIDFDEKEEWVYYLHDEVDNVTYFADEYAIMSSLNSWFYDESTTVESYSEHGTPTSVQYHFELGDEYMEDAVLKGKVRVYENGRQIWNIQRLHLPSIEEGDSEATFRYKLRYKPGNIEIEAPEGTQG